MKEPMGFKSIVVLLVFLSAVLYFAHYLIFHDLHHILVYLVGDIAFLPLEVLLVTVILHRLLEHHERRSRLEKLNMVVGVFFTEMGTDMLSWLAAKDAKKEGFGELFAGIRDWDDRKFAQELAGLAAIKPHVQCSAREMAELNEFVGKRKEVLVRLLENPNLLEHETFTELLWAATHVVEELGARKDLAAAPEADLAHLNLDINRAYAILVREWIHYLRHLKARYPYLFAFAVRTNPFDAKAEITVK